MMTRRFVSAILVFGMVFSGIPLAPAAPAVSSLPAGVGLLTYVEGRVDRNSGTDYTPMIKEELVSVGDTIRTKSYSRAEIVFHDKSVLRIGDNSQVQIKDYALNGDKRENARLFVDRGKVRVMVSKSNTGETNFSIDTPNAAGSVKGSDICVSFLKSSTSILALQGEIQAKSVEFPEKEIKIQRGTTAYVPYGSAPYAPRPYLTAEQKKFESDTNPRPANPDMSGVRKAVIARMVGPVRVRAKGAAEWHPAAIKEVLSAGDEIETGVNGKVQIVMESGRVINMKPNSHLKVVRLTRDPQTGSLEDEFESKLGEILAKVDKRKAGSKLTITTPVAVAAVKGTLLYLFITKQLTKSYFEQGNGSLTNLIKNASMDINAGKNGSVDASGGSTGPADTTPAELDEIDKDWDIDDDTYGYTPPPGAAYIPPVDEIADDLDLSGNENADRPYDDIKPGPTSDILEALNLQLFGIWGGESNEASLYANNNGWFQWSGEEFGDILAAAFPWSSPQAFLISGGQFFDVTEGELPLLFNSIITSQIPDIELNPAFSQATSDGGAFYGFAAGLWSGVEGTLAALFVDPAHNVGVFNGFSSGSFDNATGTWTASGIIAPTVLGNFPDIQPEYFSEYTRRGWASGGLSGGFDGDGFMESNLAEGSQTLFLVDSGRTPYPSFDFGIYNFRFNGGAFYQPEGADEWNAVAGGWGSFGLYMIDEYCDRNDEGYWLAQLGGTWADGEIRGAMSGAFLTQTHLGVLGGGVSGLFLNGEGGNFILQSVGSYESTQLSFFSFIEACLKGFDGNEGELNAYFGGTGSLFTDGGMASLFAIGEFLLDCEAGSQQIWSTTLSPYNVLDGGSSTAFNGGSYYAYSAGSINYGSINGRFVGIYVGPQDGETSLSSAGLAKGSVAGQTSEDIEMFSFSGNDTLSTEMEQVGISPYDVNDGSVRETNGRGKFEGVFVGGEEGTAGEISAKDSFHTASLVDYGNGYAANWGIYRQEFSRTEFYNPLESTSFFGVMGGNDAFGFYSYESEEEYFEFNDDNGFWIAEITDGEWVDGAMSAHLSGRFLTGTKVGTLEGDILGVYEEYTSEGDWLANGVGIWSGVSLDFAGNVLDAGVESEFDGSFAYFAGESFDSFGTLDNSILGGVGSLSGESHVVFMGKYDLDCEPTPVLWGLEFASSSVYSELPVTFAGDGFYGFAGGRWSNGQVHGGARMIYILNDGGEESGYTAGVTGGDLDGSYVELGREGQGMWVAEGDFLAQEKGLTWIEPEDLNNVEAEPLEEKFFVTAGATSFSQQENLQLEGVGVGPMINLSGSDWGIWAAFFGGYYGFNSEGEMGSAFRLGLAGIGEEEYEGEGEGYPVYIFGTLAGTFDALDEFSGNVDADFNGVWISEQGTQENEFVKVGTLSGQAAGDFAASEGSGGTWETAGVGEWATITELDPNVINFNEIQDVISQIGIGEILNTVAAGAGSFNEGAGSITGNMDISFFSNFLSDSGIWSALFAGSFAGAPSEISNWTATFTAPGDTTVTAQLEGINWQDGQWLANVTGNVGETSVFSGQAGGSYTQNEVDPSSGTFSGVGVGTFESPCQECT